ncbi:MAG: PilC/PilY family type IV pilus protein [Betaproteobacteria bacterium]
MKTLRPQTRTRRAMASVLAFLIAFGPVSPMMAYAATTTPLADGPIAVNIKAKPNIVFTLDDSTSMQLEFLPDYVVVNALTNAATAYCRAATGALVACGSVGSATIPQYDYATWMAGATGAVATFPYPAGYGNSSYGPPIVMTASFNAMFYNPLVTYTAPLKYDGSSYANMDTTVTAAWSKVPADPYLFPAKFVDLRTKVNVGVWCNTTYAGTQAVTNGITIGGDYCRVNGWTYAAGATNGAPAVLGDYHYPFGRATGATPLANFFATTTRTLYCDPNRMNGTSSAGTSQVAPTAPTCNACAASCPVAQVEDPASPAGCDVGCTNPAECTKCALKCPVALTYSCGTTCTTPAINCTASGGGNFAAQGPVTCTAGANQKCTTHPGSCATTGGAWVAGPNACSTVITGNSKTKATDPVPAGTIGKTYEQDANANGDVCRRNNFTYGATTAGGWTYPSGKYTTASAACSTITASINRHYYKAAVQWCNAVLPTANSNDKWRGYGTGTCQAEKTAVFQYPRFFKAGVHPSADYATAQDNYGANVAFELVELDYANKKIIVSNGTPATTISHTTEDGLLSISRDVTSTTPDASELVNYANWFAYYRSRMLAAKTVTSLAFSELTDKFRVGFHTLSNLPATSFLTVDDFKGASGAQRDLWYQKLVGVKIPMGNDTPLLSGVARIGDWFMASSGTHPDLSGSTNPINLSCQKNYHIMFTDGYTNQNAIPTTTVGNIDGAVIPASTSDTMPEVVTNFVPGGPWPNRIKEGTTAVANSLSDYTLYYWMKDLRPPTFAAAVAENNVPTTAFDGAKWQHLNFAALSLGTEGVLSSFDAKKTEGLIDTGALKWTTPAPTVNRPGVTGVDDLWHAAISGASQFVNARDPQSLQTGMASILEEIGFSQASRAGAAFTSVNFTATDNYVYRVTIEPGWGGTLTKVLVDPKGGGEATTSTVDYHSVLAAQVTPASVGDEPWYDKRNVITWSPTASKAVAFRVADIESTQASTLGPNATVQKKVIDYLRGDRSNEGPYLRNFRSRTQILGDIVNSSPVVVGDPKGQYSDSTDPGYEAFKLAKTGRKKMVYVGANDGMLHAFDEAVGTEVWAYIPSFAFDAATDKGLKVLTKKVPFFKHQMFVDSTPVVADVDIGGTWKTVLVGGLGKGGKGYYAVDITTPTDVTSESTAAAKVMWEFTDGDMGYSYGKPLIAKTYKYGWVAIVTSGYENPKKGRLYVLNLATGAILEELETNVADDVQSGLAQVSGFVLSFKNQFLEQIYGGDLLGNVWRWDVSSTDSSKWGAVKFAEFTSKDPAGSAQAVTIAPQIEVDFANGVDRYVMIGTGRLLHEDDLVTYGSQQQTMYAIRDGTALKMNSTGLPHKPRTDAAFSELIDEIAGFSALTVKGWYHDLPMGERIIAPIAAELNLLGYAGSLPPDNECIPGLSANIYVRDFPHAASQLPDGSDGDSDPDKSISAPEGAVGMEFVNIYSDTPNDPTLKLAITLGTTGKTIYIDLAKGTIAGDHRMSWRLIGQ